MLTVEYTEAQINAGASQAIGVKVDDYNTKADWTYTNEIVYSIEVKDAGTTLLSLAVKDADEVSNPAKSFIFLTHGQVPLLLCLQVLQGFPSHGTCAR